MWNMGRVKIVVWVGLNCDVRFMSCLELYWVASSFVELHQLRWAVWILVVSFSWTLVRHWVKCFRSCYLNRWFCSNNKILSCFVANTVLGNVKKPKVGGGWVAVHCDVKSSYLRLWKYSFDLLVFFSFFYLKNDTDIKPSPTPYSEMMLCLCLSLHKVDRSLVSRRYNGSTEIRVERVEK